MIIPNRARLKAGRMNGFIPCQVSIEKEELREDKTPLNETHLRHIKGRAIFKIRATMILLTTLGYILLASLARKP